MQSLTPTANGRTTRRTRVLIVDDSPSISERLVRLLGSEPGIELIGAAHDVATAVENITVGRPHAVVLDLQLGSGSGFEVLRRLQGLRPRPGVIVLTNHASEEHRKRCLELGASAFLDKSTEFELVLQAIQQAERSTVAPMGPTPVVRHILGSLPDPVVLLAPGFVITFASDAARKDFRIAEERLSSGRRLLELLHPEDRTAAWNAFGECLANGASTVDVRVETVDAGWLHVEAVAVDRTSDPVIGSVVVTLRDRTLKVQSERAVAEANSSLELALEASGAGLWDWNLRSNRLRINGSWKGRLGHDSREGDDPFQAWIERVHPDDTERLLLELDAVRRGETPELATVMRLLSGHGTYRWVRARGMVERDVAGEALRMRGSVVDVTEEKQVNAALEASLVVTRALIEDAPAAMLLLEADGRVAWANAKAAGLTGYAPADLIGLNIAETFLPDERNDVDCYLEGLAVGQPLALERDLVRPDATVIRVESSARRLPDGRIQSVIHDLTAMREREDRQRQAQKLEALGEFTSGIVHDLNNILTVILASASFLAQDQSLSEAQAECLTDISGAASRGSKMIKRLTSFARGDALAMKAVSPGPLLAEISAALRHLVPSNIAVSLECPTDLPDIIADPVAIEQILYNLATNARDAMPKGGSLHLEATLVDAAPDCEAAQEMIFPRSLRIAVTDTGQGMEQETLTRAFEPFFSTKPRNLGTGLGLAMVYGLMRQHRGSASVSSQPGQGTTVTLLFPVIAS